MAGRRSYQRVTPVPGYQYYHINAAQASSTQINTATHGAVLARIVINQAGTGMTLTLTDGSGGSVIAIATSSSTNPLVYEVEAINGLYYTYTGTTPGDLTVTFLDMV